MRHAPTVSDRKQALRAEVLRRRGRLTPAQHELAAATLFAGVLEAAAQSGRPGPVAVYASVGTEPSTRPLLAALPDVLLPVLLADGDLDWARYEGELVPGPGGTVAPPGPRLGRDAVAACPLVVVPALAVDRVGTRLGRGGGAYDRALARTSGRVLAALHEGELVDVLPAERHDRPVHAAVVPGLGTVALRAHTAVTHGTPPGEMDP